MFLIYQKSDIVVEFKGVKLTNLLHENTYRYIYIMWQMYEEIQGFELIVEWKMK